MYTLIDKQVRQWCHNNGWTDHFLQNGQFYAFPPKSVIPIPVPMKITRLYYRLFTWWQFFLILSA